MSKRRTESTTSSSSTESENYSPDTDGSSQSSVDDTSFTLASHGHKKRKKSHQVRPGNGRKSLVVQREHTPVASTSTQLQSELRYFVKQEVTEMEVENIELAQPPPQMMDVTCSTTSAVALQSTTDMRRSKQKRDSSNVSTSEVPKQPPLSRKVPKKYKKFFEGCLVIGRIRDHPWPGMIRKAGEDDHDEPDFISYYGHDNTKFCVQLFKDPTTLHWLLPCSLRIFDASKPNRGHHRDPKDVVSFKKGIQIAKAALNYSVDARLEKFTLPSGAAIDNLLTEIDIDNFHNTNATTQQPHPPVPQNNLLLQNRNAAAAITQENGVSSPDLVTENDEESTLPSNENGEIGHESVEIMMRRRISEYQQKLRDECNREKDEIIRRLVGDKAELEAIVEEKEKAIVDLSEAFEEKNLKQRKEMEEAHLKHRKEMEENNQKYRMEMEKVNLKYKKEMEKQKQEKRKLQHELETRKAVFEKMFP